MKNSFLFCLMLAGFLTAHAEAGIENRPLNTDDADTLPMDTGTVAFGMVYVNEANGTDVLDFPLDLGFGVRENFEITVNIPFSYVNPEPGPDVAGFADISIRPELKFMEETETLPALSDRVQTRQRRRGPRPGFRRRGLLPLPAGEQAVRTDDPAFQPRLQFHR